MTCITAAMLPAEGRENSKLAGLTPDRIYKRTAKGFRFSRTFKRKLWEASGCRCAYCGDPIADHGALHVDHLVPRSEDGTEHIDNLVCACAFCNSSKGSGGLDALRFNIAVAKSPIGGIVSPKQARALLDAGATLPIDAERLFYFELVASGRAL